MANSLFNMERSTTPAGVAQRALRYMGEPVGFSTLRWLGADPAQALAEHLQDCEREMLNELTMLNIETVSLVVTANTSVVAVPGTLRIVDIYGVRWDNTGSTNYQYEDYPVALVTSMQMDAYWPGWRGTTETDAWPSYVVVDLESGGNLRLVPTPTTARTLTMVLRKNGATYDADSMTSDVIFVLIPTDIVKVLAYRMAAELALIKYPDTARHDALMAQYRDGLDYWSNKLVDLPATMGLKTFATLGNIQPAGYSSLPI